MLATALSGGLVPCGAVLMSEAVSDSVYRSLKRAVIHASTYSENGLAMRAAMTTLDVLEDERLGERAWARDCARGLEARLSRFEMVGEIRGLGLLSGIEFKRPKGCACESPSRPS